MNDQVERDREERLRFSGFYDWLDLCGLTQDEFDGLLRKQDNKCFVCDGSLGESTNLIDLVSGPAKLCRALICSGCADKLEKRI